MYSQFFKLNIKDISRGLIVAILAVVLGAIQNALGEHGLDVAAYDWGSILDLAVTAAVAYLGKNLLSTEDGKVLGSIG